MMGAAVLEATCASPCDDWASGISFIPSGVEVHWLSGAAFLFVGALLVVEALAGRVWYRGYAGRLIWPAAVIAVGIGSLISAYLGPTDKAAHALLGISLVVGGLFEGGYRVGRVQRGTGDVFVISALILGGFIIGPLHLQGSIIGSVPTQIHLLLGLTGFAMAGIRIMQRSHPSSALVAGSFGVLMVALAFQLLLMPGEHH